jgi:hypothetical protein
MGTALIKEKHTSKLKSERGLEYIPIKRANGEG